MRELLLLVVLALASTLASPACESPPPPNAVRVYRTAAQSIAIPLQVSLYLSLFLLALFYLGFLFLWLAFHTQRQHSHNSVSLPVSLV